MTKKITLWILSILVLTAFVGCQSETLSSEPTTDPAQSDQSVLTFEGVDAQSFNISVTDIKSFVEVEGDFPTLDSAGNELVFHVKGASLNAILAEHGTSLSDYQTVRAIAADGYEVDIPQEILSKKDIVLMWECDGEAEQPLRVAIDDERSMYWVSMLSKLQFVGGPVAEQEDSTQIEATNPSKVVFLETAASTLPTQDIDGDTGFMVKDLFSKFAENTPDTFQFTATDGFTKSENTSVLEGGYINMTGEFAPHFNGQELPNGMQIKYIQSMVSESVAFASIKSFDDAQDMITINEQSGVCIQNILDSLGMQSELFSIIAADGYQYDVSKDDLKNGILYINEDEKICSIFKEDLPKKAWVQDIISIQAVEQ